ncbi:hypothetical protein GXB85_13485 [Cellulomonas sp. APG4]|uniref:zinc-ribbon domain-containing protein n=1 Tax=Cellulomonas sp. APG4 TaxID=1538656 RepID=UPI001379DEF7|nr:hypothetical protein [Cellulomonas sp. APG4]
MHFPDLATEWAEGNPLSAWHVRPSGSTPFVPTWVCSNNATHVWQASLTSRTNGSGCPECREHGKSQVELDHYAAAERAFGNASSGRSLRHSTFTHRAAWTADIAIDLDDGRVLIVEYDGAYWHAGKRDVDAAKSRDLLAAGYVLARLREHPLAALDVEHPCYTELVVYATAPDPDAAMASLRDWVDRRTTPEKPDSR